MEQLTLSEIQSLNQGIQQLYTLQNLDTFGVDALLVINQLVPSEVPIFHLTNVRTRQVTETFLPDFLGLSPELVQTKTHYLCEHPIAQNMPEALNGACKISDFISRQELHSQSIYQDFLRPLDTEDQMMLFLPNTPSGDWQQLAAADVTLVGFALARSQRSFTERDRLLLNLLRPHLLQSYINTQKQQQLQQSLDNLHKSIDPLGVVILDNNGHVQMITTQASFWLAKYFPSSCALFPDHVWSWVKHQVAGFMEMADLAPACLPLRVQQAGQQLIIRLITRPNNQYLLLLEEQATSLLDSLKLLGLSQRETEVLGWVLQGKDNKLIAGQLGVGISTIRKHLESIFAKLGVKSRTEAIAHTLKKLGFL